MEEQQNKPFRWREFLWNTFITMLALGMFYLVVGKVSFVNTQSTSRMIEADYGVDLGTGLTLLAGALLLISITRK